MNSTRLWRSSTLPSPAVTHYEYRIDRQIYHRPRPGRAKRGTFRAFNPTTGEPVGPDFYSASLDELNRAAELAGQARIPFGNIPGRERAKFLRAIADNIEALGDALIERASLETALPNGRFVGERARTCGQLRMFADLLDDGSWVDARIDHSMPERQPVPKPDVRSMLRPLGPVAVFCASNFPLAYSGRGRRYRIGSGGRLSRYCQRPYRPSRNGRACRDRGSKSGPGLRHARRSFQPLVFRWL